jgi:hypothetical protein
LPSLILAKLRALFLVSVAFCASSFAYSFVGFLSPQPPSGVHHYEEPFSKTFVEVGGHFLFGLLAAFPLMQWELILVGGMFAVLIDADHIPSELGLAVGGYGRPDHSILYMLLSAVLFYHVGRKVGLGGRQVSLVLVAAILSHLSYDVFYSNGMGGSFPLLVPFNFGLIAFPYWSWPVFEIAGVLLAGMTNLTVRKMHAT